MASTKRETKKLTVEQAFQLWKQGTGRKALRPRIEPKVYFLTPKFVELAGGEGAFKKLQAQRKVAKRAAGKEASK